jgi:two-component system NtrC family sensor kinase
MFPTTESPGRARSLLASLSTSLLLWLFGTVLVAFAAYATLNARTTSRHWQETVESSALRLGEVIKQSTHHGMLLNRKEDVHHIIQTVARAPGVAGVRIYDKLGRIVYSAASEEIGRQVDLEAEACVVCHQRERPLESVPREGRVRVFRGPDGERVLGLIHPIPNEPACSTASCHAHPPGKTVLGVLDVKLSMAEADSRLAATRRLSAAAAAGIALAVGGVSAVFIDRMVRRPVGKLIEGTARVARGELDASLAVSSPNEIGQLARAFSHMTRDLARAQEENAAWALELEAKVREKTEEASRAQRQVIHMEKMVSLGQLAATVAHELNNPLAGILAYAKLVSRSLQEGIGSPQEQGDVERFLAVIQQESSRCGDIVKNLLLFARRSGVRFESQPLNPIIDRAVLLVRHLAELRKIVLTVEPLAGDDRVVCDAAEIQQALVALLINAVEAMAEGGALRVAATEVGAAVELAVADSGSGIEAGDLPRIFEPFYTTKADSSGAGLGLAVVFGIVQRHGGSIDVESAVGRGTTFRLRLPRRPPEEGDHA